MTSLHVVRGAVAAAAVCKEMTAINEVGLKLCFLFAVRVERELTCVASSGVALQAPSMVSLTC